MSIRLDSGDDSESERSDGDAESENRTFTRWLRNPDDPGGVFVRLALAFSALTVLSLLAVVAALLGAAEEPFVDQPTLENPLSGWLWLLSQTAAAASVFGYAVWSFRKQRRLKRRAADRSGVSLFKKPLWFFKVASKDGSEYEARVQKTVFALVVAVFVGNLPVRILLNAFL